MKAVLLAGGLGTRISEETHLKPKPMVEIGGFPILWHIMKIYSHYNVNDFIICCGYKGYMIKEYFSNYFIHRSDITIDLKDNSIEVHKKNSEPWKITLVDTGLETMTGGRLSRVKDYLDGTFCMTYGDGLSDVNIGNLLSHHASSSKLATLTAVKPPGRFGALEIDCSTITSFQEKPRGDGTWINGGFFVLEPDVINLIDGPDCVWEDQPLKSLANQGQLSAFRHEGFWQPMDTLRDKNYLEKLWSTNAAPWKY